MNRYAPSACVLSRSLRLETILLRGLSSCIPNVSYGLEDDLTMRRGLGKSLRSPHSPLRRTYRALSLLTRDVWVRVSLNVSHSYLMMERSDELLVEDYVYLPPTKSFRVFDG